MRGLLFELLRYNELHLTNQSADEESNSSIETVLIPSFAFGQWSNSFETKKFVNFHSVACAPFVSLDLFSVVIERKLSFALLEPPVCRYLRGV